MYLKADLNGMIFALYDYREQLACIMTSQQMMSCKLNPRHSYDTLWMLKWKLCACGLRVHNRNAGFGYFLWWYSGYDLKKGARSGNFGSERGRDFLFLLGGDAGIVRKGSRDMGIKFCCDYILTPLCSPPLYWSPRKWIQPNLSIITFSCFCLIPVLGKDGVRERSKKRSGVRPRN